MQALSVHPGELIMAAKPIWLHAFSAGRICNNASLHKRRLSHCFSADFSLRDGLP
jgi:hypothetical protein